MNDSSSNAYESASSSPSTQTNIPATQWRPASIPSLCACILGTAISGAFIHFFAPVFQLPQLPELGISPSSEAVQRYVAAQMSFWSSNYAFDFALIGLCIGVSMGVFTTNHQRGSSGIAGGTGGLLGGLAAGYFLGLAVAKNILSSADQSLIFSTAYHAAAWASLLGGLVFAIALVQDGIGRALNALPVGVLAGLAVATIFNVTSSFCFADSNLLRLIPSSTLVRVYWVVVCSIVSGYSLYIGLRPSGPKKTT